MRRLLALLICVGLALFGLSLVPTAHAAGPLTGKLVDATGTHPPVAGATVRLRLVTGSGPGAIVDTDTTSSAGSFALDAGPSPEDEYYVQVVPGEYQGGYVGGGTPRFVQPTAGGALTWSADAHIGTIRANPAFIRGVLIDSVTHDPVPGVKVTSRSSTDISAIEGSDVTNRRGVFKVTGLTCEDDCYLKFNGGSAYETGFRACNGGVVPTWGAACASPIGRIGKVRIDAK
ncbi:hypothetical protein [Nocardioides sp. SR21]|uniref:hypothetical protein n=1 Tax=Nocardioides sp. SR21 TaxID=2919501 RepID=UPI001FAAE29C|nr:hypothetical protein [Nocardioides sp. SR21]